MQFFVKVRYDHRVGNYRCLSRRAVTYFREYRERTRNVNAIMAIMGVPTTIIDVQHQAARRRHAAATRCTAPPSSPSTCWSATPRCRCSWWSSSASTVIARGPGPPRLADVGRRPIPIARCRPSLTGTALLALIGGLVILAIGTVGVYLTKSFVESMKRPLYFVDTRRGLPS